MSQTEHIVPSAQARALTQEEIDDAAFRASDLAWSVVLDKFTKQQEETGFTYKALGDRIRRSKSQVQRWLSSPFNMNIRSLGLLAEGLGLDLVIDLQERCEPDPCSNYLHPAERAKSKYHHDKVIESVMIVPTLGGSIERTTSSGTSVELLGNAKNIKSLNWEQAIV